MAFVTSDIADPNPNNNTNSVTVSATAPFDADGDGMPNWWEQRYGLVFSGGLGGTGDNGPDGDPDLDGVRNLDEWIADTDPKDPDSRLEIADQVFEAGAGEFSLTIESSPIRLYVLEFTDDLSQPFTEVETVNGTGAPISFSHTSGTSLGYYRVQVRIPVS